MQRGFQTTVTRPQTGIAVQTNSVIRNTYILLSLTLLFSAVMAGVSMVTNAPPMGFGMLIGYFGLLYLTAFLRNSVWGIAAIFAFTGFMGYTLGPLLNMIMSSYTNGAQLVMTAFGLTGIIFMGLSAYALTTRKDFSYMIGFLFAAGMLAFVASLVAVFLHIPMLYLGMCALFVLIASGMILFQTSQIIHGGERNYIMATISLYVSIYNLFVSLLQLLALFAGRRD